MKRSPFYFLTILSFVLLNCNAQKKGIEVQLVNQNWSNGTSLLKHVTVLSSDAFKGRRTGTKGAKKAKNYIIEQLKDLNVSPLIPNYSQPFTFESRNKTYNWENILGLIKGSKTPDSYIVISAHYDHEGIKDGKIYNGVDDDATGISALIAFAEYFKIHPPKHSVILAAVDAEELELQGSKYFVENSIVPLENIALNRETG